MTNPGSPLAMVVERCAICGWDFYAYGERRICRRCEDELISRKKDGDGDAAQKES